MKKGKETIVDIVYISCTDNICVFSGNQKQIIRHGSVACTHAITTCIAWMNGRTRHRTL